jgi:hypothetical protein
LWFGKNVQESDTLGSILVQPTSTPAFFHAATISSCRALGGCFFADGGSAELKPHVANSLAITIPRTVPRHVQHRDGMGHLRESKCKAIAIIASIHGQSKHLRIAGRQQKWPTGKRIFSGNGAEGDRTPNLSIANAALSQLSYGPKDYGILHFPQEESTAGDSARLSAIEDFLQPFL